MHLLFWLSLVVIPGLPWWAANAMGATPQDTTVARTLLVLAALWAAAVGMAWLLTDNGPAAMRIAIGLLIGAYVFVGLPQALGWVRAREAAGPAVTVLPTPVPAPAPLPAAVHAPPAAPPPAAPPPAAQLAPAPPPVAATRPPMFRELFEQDFATLPSLARNVGLQSAKTGEKTQVPIRLILNPATHQKTVAIFIERNTSSFNTCVFFLYNLQTVFQELNVVAMEANAPGPHLPLYGKDFPFDHNIYFYLAEEMSQEARGYLQKAFRDQGITAHFRGAAYYAMHIHDENLQQPN